MEWKEPLLELLSFLLPVLASVLAIVLTALAKRGLDKMGVERSEKIDDMIDRYVGIGIDYAERAAKLKLDGRAYNGENKLTLATKTVLDELAQSGIRDVGESLIRARIEHALELKERQKTDPLAQ